MTAATFIRQWLIYAGKPLLAASLLVPDLTLAADAQNYAALRLEFARQPGYNATAQLLKENALAHEAHMLWSTGHGEETVAKIQVMLEQYPLSLLANVMMAETCSKLAEHTVDSARKSELTILSNEHQERYDLLVKSITKESQCSTPEDRCVVINVSEEYLVMHSMHFQKKSQRLSFRNRVPYDVLVGTSVDGTEKTFYFDISPFFDISPSNEMSSKAPVDSPPEPPAQ